MGTGYSLQAKERPTPDPSMDLWDITLKQSFDVKCTKKMRWLRSGPSAFLISALNLGDSAAPTDSERSAPFQKFHDSSRRKRGWRTIPAERATEARTQVSGT